MFKLHVDQPEALKHVRSVRGWVVIVLMLGSAQRANFSQDIPYPEEGKTRYLKDSPMFQLSRGLASEERYNLFSPEAKPKREGVY